MMSTKIEWTNKTWNPIVGCTHASIGCQNCYAERMANRLSKNPVTKEKYGSVIGPDGKWNGKTNFIPEELEKPMKWKKPAMIFVCSMSDLFHTSNSFDWIDEVMKVILNSERHIFQILTKRPEIAKRYFSTFKADKYFPPKNLWIGVSAENQEQADNRIPALLEIPAKVRFVSAEPLLSKVDLRNIDANNYENFCMINALTGDHTDMGRPYFPVNKLDWVIAGPETGPKSRPMKYEWIESLAYQCESAGVAFFDKKNILSKNIQQYP